MGDDELAQGHQPNSQDAVEHEAGAWDCDILAFMSRYAKRDRRELLEVGGMGTAAYA